MRWIGRRGRGFGRSFRSRTGSIGVEAVLLGEVELGLMLRAVVARLGMARLGASLRILVVGEDLFHRRVVAAIITALGAGVHLMPVRCPHRMVELMMSGGEVRVGAVEEVEGEGGEGVMEEARTQTLAVFDSPSRT